MLIRKKGMTLLEILVALTIFASAFVYISQMLKFHVKQQKKISRNIEISRITENVFEILKQDLKKAVFFYDINFHFLQFYPMVTQSTSEFSTGEIVPSEQAQNIMEPQFDFSGKENKLQFASLVMVSTGPDKPPTPHLRKVEYFLRSCKSFRTNQSSQCLARGTSKSWKDIEDTQNQEITNLLEGIKSVKFSYFDEEEWKREWNFSNQWKQAAKKPTQRSSLLPSLVKVQIEWETEKKLLKATYNFAVSHPFLRFHQPGKISAMAFLDVGRASQITKPEDPSENNQETEQDTPPPGVSSENN